VIVRAPTGCRASGAARFLNKEKGLIQLSGRYLSDDQFWFTLFHEIGHILLHAKDGLMLEIGDGEKSTPEAEADAFALDALFAEVGVDALKSVEPSMFGIVRLARKAGVPNGLVVGQLQARGRIPYSYFQRLKIRYTWESAES
jgi:Zn-dependent peptidase ImmA (M78 family)